MLTTRPQRRSGYKLKIVKDVLSIIADKEKRTGIWNTNIIPEGHAVA
jgi:hypothetical protein